MTTNDQPPINEVRIVGMVVMHEKYLKNDLKGKRFVLRGENLQGFDFREVNLTSADLAYCDLRNADFTGANLTFADLRGADLRGADFRDAELVGASLERAKLEGAIMPNGRKWKDHPQRDPKGTMRFQDQVRPIGMSGLAEEVHKNHPKPKR